MIPDLSALTTANERVYNYAMLGYCLGAAGLTIVLSALAVSGVV
ncbi:hypothetical protein [Halovivax cerinus]|uniref:Uncharacterized protein n=1 Tax=Halovivax cerinus TaxID=1487865 RepID=A0ABD5NUV4_9EURY|nr:hypothetical protein [Halovivax cerinus]